MSYYSASCIYAKSYSDDELDDIFASVNDMRVTHGSEDALRGLSIPMKPDRVWGLKAPSRMIHNHDFFPAENRHLTLPFLVVEAKKDDSGVGFRAMQYQTAFPIRRFLKAQTALRGDDTTSEPSLVWFLAWQGELWRLHACIEDGSHVVRLSLPCGTCHVN